MPVLDYDPDNDLYTDYLENDNISEDNLSNTIRRRDTSFPSDIFKYTLSCLCFSLLILFTIFILLTWTNYTNKEHYVPDKGRNIIDTQRNIKIAMEANFLKDMTDREDFESDRYNKKVVYYTTFDGNILYSYCDEYYEKFNFENDFIKVKGCNNLNLCLKPITYKESIKNLASILLGYQQYNVTEDLKELYKNCQKHIFLV